MLVACTSCHQQYDVGDLSIGSKVHCHCGEYVTVPEFRARDAKILHCSGCGAHLDQGAETCAYCRATVDRSEHNFGPACPECFSRMVTAARYCCSCGVEIAAEKIETQQLDQDCPRCDNKLIQRNVKNGSFSECTGCGGLWLAEGTFDRLVIDKDEGAVGAFMQISTDVERRRTVFDDKIEEVRYLKCPVCAELMHRRNFGRASGVIIDSCKGHGFWFDCFELEAVLEFVQKGGLDKARERDLRDQKRKVALAKERAVSAARTEARGHGLGRNWSGGGSLSPDLFDLVGWLANWLFKR
ncbi:MAG: zf-TFIIB domain-containing protein [Planctomycetota bacterium]